MIRNTPLSSLKPVFARARALSNIDLVAPAFRPARLFVVGKAMPTDGEPVFYLAKSRNPDRLCVTVSESPEWLRSLEDVTLIEMTGAQLLDRIDSKYEVIVVYDDGGDHLSLEQLDWIRQPQSGPDYLFARETSVNCPGNISKK